MPIVTTKTKRALCRVGRLRNRKAERLERDYRELGFVPNGSLRRILSVDAGFVFTPPSFLPAVEYTVTTLAGE